MARFALPLARREQVPRQLRDDLREVAVERREELRRLGLVAGAEAGGGDLTRRLAYRGFEPGRVYGRRGPGYEAARVKRQRKERFLAAAALQFGEASEALGTSTDTSTCSPST